MIAALNDDVVESDWTRWAHRLVGAVTLLGWLLVAGIVAASYVGHSSSPYGTCHNAKGRGIQCLAGRR